MISLIAAVAANSVIGKNNALPWRLPDDLRRFKALTWGKPVVMGRQTFESLGRPLAGRENRIITHDQNFQVSGCLVFTELNAALAGDFPEIMVIGGAKLYAQTIHCAQRLYLTEIDVEIPGDAFFPIFDTADWDELSVETHPSDDRHPLAFRFRTLERRKDRP